MTRDYLDFDLALTREGSAYAVHVVSSPVGEASAPFVLPFEATELAQFMVAVGPPREVSRRLVPVAARVGSVKDYGRRLGDALLSGPVRTAFDASLDAAGAKGKDLRLRLRLDAVPELDPVPWEYLYDAPLERFLTLSQQTPVVRLLDSLRRPPPVAVTAPLRVLVVISSPADLPALAVDREKQLLLATTADMVKTGQLAVTVLDTATLTELQRALLGDFHVLHFIGHGGFDETAQEGVLALEREDGTSHLVSGARLGTLLHDAHDLQLAVLNACEGARTSGRDAFSGVGQALVRQGLPAVVAMQTEISDRAALVFSHEFYWFLSCGLGIDASICEVRKAMAVSDEASEWGTAVLLRSGSDQPFTFTGTSPSRPAPQGRLDSLYSAARTAIAAGSPETAKPLLEQITAEQPDFRDATTLLARVRPEPVPETLPLTPIDTPIDPAPVTHEPTPRRAPARRPARRTIVRGVALLGVLGVAWVGWRLFPSLVQKVEPLVGVACGSSVAASPSGAAATFHLGCAPVAPKIDGSFDDWRSVPVGVIDAVAAPTLPAQNGFGGTWQGLWDRDGLYLRVVVTDPSLRPVNETKPGTWWTGDGFSFEVGPDPRALPPSAALRPGKDLHVLIGLTGDSDRGAAAAINPVGADKRGALSFVTGRRAPAVTVAERRTATGYQIEALVPWSELGRTLPPQRGDVLGFNVNLSDASPTGALRTMLTSNPKRSATNQTHPGTWQTVVLTDASGD